MDAAVAAIAERQFGVFTLAQAHAAGVTRSAVHHRVQTGRWRRAGRGPFVLAGAPPSREQRVLAAVLSGGPGTVATGSAAATLWGLPGFDDRPIEVLRLRGRSRA